MVPPEFVMSPLSVRCELAGTFTFPAIVSQARVAGLPPGALVSMMEGVATAYSLFNLQERGKLFIGPAEAVYNGMIVGENARENDLEVNVIKGKKLSNVRASGADDAIILEPPREITLEYGLEFIRDDELVEVTPDAIRLRKRMLTSHERKRDRRVASGG